jgi:GAF domain-containing protein
MKETLILGQTVLTECFEKNADLILGDPADHQNFSVEYDLPLFRGFKSMIILPIVNPSDEIVAAMQCSGFQSPEADLQSDFPEYYIEVLKIAREIIQKKFFSAVIPRTVPSNISNIFNDIETSTLPKTAQQICRYLQTAFPCAAAELFEFDDRYRTLIRLTDGKKFGEIEGGISFQAGLIKAPINLADNQRHPNFCQEIDGVLANKAILTRSFHQGRDHFVLTLRAKPNLPGFTPQDSRLLSEVSFVVCDALRLAKWLEVRAKERETAGDEMKLLHAARDSLANVATLGADRWTEVQSAAKHFFDCEKLFICMFDGRFIKYTPTEIRCKFEDCAAGVSFNYRETVVTVVGDEKAKFNASLYEQLGVDLQSSICFPYRINGRVAGSIEIINPKREGITPEEQQLFATLCGCLMAPAS